MHMHSLFFTFYVVSWSWQLGMVWAPSLFELQPAALGPCMAVAAVFDTLAWLERWSYRCWYRTDRLDEKALSLERDIAKLEGMVLEQNKRIAKLEKESSRVALTKVVKKGEMKKETEKGAKKRPSTASGSKYAKCKWERLQHRWR